MPVLPLYTIYIVNVNIPNKRKMLTNSSIKPKIKGEKDFLTALLKYHEEIGKHNHALV